MALIGCARGSSHITETIVRNRFMHVQELARFGAENGAVDTVTGLIPAPLRATRMPSLLTEITAPAWVRMSSGRLQELGRAPASCTSPPVIATAIA